ncbi:MAG: riboflavin synthase [Akkermansiaceae bacterium]|jgi:riboflavin synthase|nr:riboflavin synthase [Akkermansiaceae bacterium]
MFTGLIEAKGRVALMENRGEQARLSLEIPFSGELALGESVAVNGCCLTVTEIGETVSFDLLAQTLKVTSLGQLSAGKIVNLERALAIGDRLGGHFVQGHVDDIGEILDLSPMGQDYLFEVKLPESIHALCLDKGSLTIDGISLTIAELKDESAVFWITPHTFAETHLGEAQIGQTVNLEADLLAKYVQKLTLQ